MPFDATRLPSIALTGNAGGSAAFGPVGAGGGGNLSTDPNKTGGEIGGGGVCGITTTNSVTGPSVGCGFPFVGNVAIYSKGGIAFGKTFDPEGMLGKHVDFLLKPIRAKIKAALKDSKLSHVDIRAGATIAIQNPHAEPYLAAGIEALDKNIVKPVDEGLVQPFERVFGGPLEGTDKPKTQ